METTLDQDNVLQKTLRIQTQRYNVTEVTVTWLSNDNIEILAEGYSEKERAKGKRTYTADSTFIKVIISPLLVIKDRARVNQTNSVYRFFMPRQGKNSNMFKSGKHSDTIFEVLVMLGKNMAIASNVIDAYFSEMVKKFESVFFVPVKFLQLKLEEKSLPINKFYTNMTSEDCLLVMDDIFFPKQFPISTKIILFPLNVIRHVYLAIMNIMEKKIYVYDSVWDYIPRKLRRFHIEVLLEQIFGIDDFETDMVGWKVEFVQNCAQQKDKNSCVMYLTQFAENYLNKNIEKNLIELSSEAIQSIRESIAIKILKTSFMGRNLVEMLAPKYVDSNVVPLHKSLLQLPNKEEENQQQRFYCSTCNQTFGSKYHRERHNKTKDHRRLYKHKYGYLDNRTKTLYQANNRKLLA